MLLGNVPSASSLCLERIILPPCVAVALAIPVWLILVVPVVGRFLIDFLNALNITVSSIS